jgi:hypothetical protein
MWRRGFNELTQLAPLRRRRAARAAICIVLLQISPAGAISGTLSGATAAAALKQNWNCQRIEKAIANLAAEMLSAKERAEKEQEQMAPTLERLLARLSGPSGAGNAALAESQEARRDADQLNDLLGEKGCATSDIGVDAPAFLK